MYRHAGPVASKRSGPLFNTAPPVREHSAHAPKASPSRTSRCLRSPAIVGRSSPCYESIHYEPTGHIAVHSPHIRAVSRIHPSAHQAAAPGLAFFAYLIRSSSGLYPDRLLKTCDGALGHHNRRPLLGLATEVSGCRFESCRANQHQYQSLISGFSPLHFMPPHRKCSG